MFTFTDQCRWCKKYFERKQSKCFTIYDGATPQCFCSKSCMNVFISNSRHIVPCNWCKVKKYNFDMIKRMQSNGQAVMMCSLNCLNLYQVSINAVSSRKYVEFVNITYFKQLQLQYLILIIYLCFPGRNVTCAREPLWHNTI